MKPTRRIKFIWGASNTVAGRWYLGLFGFYTRERGVPYGAIAISMRGVLAWGGFAAAVAYMAAATALFFVWARNPYSLLSYSDALFYPVRRAAIAEKKGQAFISEGLDAMRAQKWQHAAMLLQQGLARFPGDLRARGALAQFYVATQQQPRAAQMLLEGLGDEYPGRAYMAQLFSVLERAEDHEAVADAAARYLARGRLADRPAERRWLTERRYAAFVAAERHAEALALAESEPEGEGASERRVLALLALGRQADAARLLEAWGRQDGANLRTVARLQVRVFRESGRIEEMKAALARLRELSPGDPAPPVYAVVQLALAGQAETAAAAFDDYVFRFGGSAENLLLVANPLAETGQLELLERCLAAANERGYPLARYRVMLIELRVRRGEWAEAAALLGRAESDPETAKGDPRRAVWLKWKRLLVGAAVLPSDGELGALVEWIRSGAWPANVYRVSAETMLRVGQVGKAQDIATAASRFFPKSPWLTKLAEEIRREAMARTAALPAESEVRQTQVLGERAFALRLSELVAAKDWDGTARHVQDALSLRPAPPWLERQEPSMRLAQVRIAQTRRDTPALAAAARQFLNGDEPRSVQLHELAIGYFEAGDKAAAVALAREIARRSPEFAPAQRSLEEWSPVTAAAPQAAKQPAPADNLPGNDEDLLERMRARRAAGDVPGLISSTRLFLNGDRSRAQRATAVAQEFFDAGDKESAARVLREVLRSSPGYPPAVRLQEKLK